MSVDEIKTEKPKRNVKENIVKIAFAIVTVAITVLKRKSRT